MAWSQCKIEIAQAQENGGMPSSLTDIGTIKDKSSTLEPSDGETLEAKATGGVTVAKEVTEGGLTLKTRIIEPDDQLRTLLGLGSTSSDGFDVKTHIVEGHFAVKLTPKNVGAKGINAPKASIIYKPGWSEEEGHYADLEFEILRGDQYWYHLFTKQASAPAAASE